MFSRLDTILACDRQQDITSFEGKDRASRASRR